MSVKSWRSAAMMLGMVSTFSLGGCAGETPGEGADHAGESGIGGVGFGLSLPDGSEVSTVNYVITRNG